MQRVATIRDGGVQGCLVLHRAGVEPLKNEREDNFLLSLLRFDVVDLVAIPVAIGYAGDMAQRVILCSGGAPPNEQIPFPTLESP